MEKLRALWEIIAPYISGGLMGGIVTMVILPFIRGKITKGFAKLNFDGFLKDMRAILAAEFNAALERIKGTVMTHSIEPLVLSEMQKVNESANERVQETCDKIHAENAALLNVLAAQAAYFDDSTVGEAKKTALHSAIADAQALFAPQTVESVVEVAEVEEAPKRPVKRKIEVVR